MTVTPQISLPSVIIDNVTPVNAASVMPNFTALRDDFNTHAHDEYATHSDLSTISLTPGPPGPPGGAIVDGWWNYNISITAPPATGQIRTAPATLTANNPMTIYLHATDADGLYYPSPSVLPGDTIRLRDSAGNVVMSTVTTFTVTVSGPTGYATIETTVNSLTGQIPKNARVEVALIKATLDPNTVPLLLPAADTRNLLSGPAARILLAGQVTGDTQNRWQIDNSNGRISWGPGNAPVDASLYRSSASRLTLDNTVLRGQRSAASSGSFEATVTGDANVRLIIGADGKHSWGDGTAVADTTLARTGVGVLAVGSANAGSLYAGSELRAQANHATERVQVGPGGVAGQAGIVFGTAQDTRLYRSAAAVLALTGMLTTTLGVATKTKAGAPVDADWATAPPDGTLVVDTTASKLWARVGGVWKGVVLA